MIPTSIRVMVANNSREDMKQLSVAEFLQLEGCSNVSAEILEALRQVHATALCRLLTRELAETLTDNLLDVTADVVLSDFEADTDAALEGAEVHGSIDVADMENDGCEAEP